MLQQGYVWNLLFHFWQLWVVYHKPPFEWSHCWGHRPVSNNGFGSVWFWLVTVLLIVWSRSLLLCLFHEKLRIWWMTSFGFCQRDNPQFSYTMYFYRYWQLTRKNLEASEFNSLRKSTKRKSLVIRLEIFHNNSYLLELRG